MITGINHINLAVADVARSFLFYTKLLGLTPLCQSKGSAYLLAGHPEEPGALWVSLDFDRTKKRVPSPCNTHLAFTVSKGNFSLLKGRLLEAGVVSFKENTSPGESFYFLDNVTWYF
ncbi:MAG: VOC family protein [Alphaproteobacteria bacterium]|nr:VOC family protein [Alphaproteobacteria bacterium]